MLTAVVGINWGDEGKGRMVDLLSRDYKMVARYQGGNNAGHTVVNPRGKFILNLLPSGILREDTVNVMGPGMVVDLEHLSGEVGRLRAAGISVTPAHLKISDRAVICMPYHKLLDNLEEDRLADRKFGSTRRGIAPVYADRYMKKVLRMADLLNPETLRGKLENILEWKNLTISGGYGHQPIAVDDMIDWLEAFGMPFADFVCDTTALLSAADSVLFEAQLGALRDIDFGIYPYTSSSTTLAAYAPIGAGIPGRRLDRVVGIMKAYSSCVGEGPFTCELFGEAGKALRDAGGEYGAATGRPRRVGGFDVPASRYGVRMQGPDELAVTKLDVLSYLDKIPVCTQYEVDGERTADFMVGDRLNRAKPVYEEMDGWKSDISGCRTFAALPKNAQMYVRFLEEAVSCRIRYVSVGAARDEYIEL
jgi:adenylosuccinate synthase